MNNYIRGVVMGSICLLGLVALACGRPLLPAHPPPAPFPEPLGPGAIQEISLEQGPCMDTSCPSYRYTFRRNGRATYDRLSQSDNRLLDRSIATVDSATFERLAAALYERGFFQMKRGYVEATDHTEITVRATLPDTVKEVTDDGDAGPAALHDLQTLLRSVGTNLRWGNATRPE